MTPGMELPCQVAQSGAAYTWPGLYCPNAALETLAEACKDKLAKEYVKCILIYLLYENCIVDRWSVLSHSITKKTYICL